MHSSTSFLSPLQAVLIHAAPAMPEQVWWMTACVVVILALAATLDAFTSLIPEKLIFVGLLAVTAMQGMFGSWESAGMHLRHAVASGLLIWVVNFLWYQKFRHDALGMGDAKWTMLAVACFGIMPSVFAWGCGAIIAVAYMAAARLVNYRLTQVTFAPFLFIGLLAGLFWMRFLTA